VAGIYLFGDSKIAFKRMKNHYDYRMKMQLPDNMGYRQSYWINQL
jgi:hypothetical protein